MVMTIEERLLEEVQVHFEEDEFDEKVIKICIRRAINAFKSKRNYPSSYDDEKIKKDYKYTLHYLTVIITLCSGCVLLYFGCCS